MIRRIPTGKRKVISLKPSPNVNGMFSSQKGEGVGEGGRWGGVLGKLTFNIEEKIIGTVHSAAHIFGPTWVDAVVSGCDVHQLDAIAFIQNLHPLLIEEPASQSSSAPSLSSSSLLSRRKMFLPPPLPPSQQRPSHNASHDQTRHLKPTEVIENNNQNNNKWLLK